MGNLAGHQTGSCSTQRLMLLGHSFILGPKSVSWDLHSLTHILVHLGCKGKVTLGHFGSRWVTHIHQTSVSHNSGGLKSKMKVSAGLISSADHGENLLHASLLASARLLAIFGVPWLLLCHPNLGINLIVALSLHACSCPNFPFL